MNTSAKSIATPQEKRTVTLLAASQALFLITAVTVMTLSGVVGQGFWRFRVGLVLLAIALLAVLCLRLTSPGTAQTAQQRQS